MTGTEERHEKLLLFLTREQFQNYQNYFFFFLFFLFLASNSNFVENIDFRTLGYHIKILEIQLLSKLNSTKLINA